MNLERLFNPASIALVGLSQSRDSIGYRTLAALKLYGYRGTISGVNPKRRELHDVPCYSAICDVPERVDLAIICLPAEQVRDSIKECDAAGVGAAVVYASGLGEGAADGGAREAAEGPSSSVGIRILGPNNQGFLNLRDGVAATFSPLALQPHRRTNAGPGESVAIVSQSGAMGFAIYREATRRGLGVSKVITTGNESDICTGQILSYLANDPETSLVLMYTEGATSVRNLLAGIEAITASGKTLGAIRVGYSAAGERAAASHTARMASDQGVLDAVLDAYGVLRARDHEELLDIAVALQRYDRRPGNRIAVVTTSGASGVLAADSSSDSGLSLPTPSRAILAELSSQLPSYAGLENPIDLTASAQERLPDVIKLISDSGQYDAMIIAGLLSADFDEPDSRDWLRRALSSSEVPAVAFSPSGISTSAREVLNDSGVPGFTTSDRVARVLRAILSPCAGSGADSRAERTRGWPTPPTGRSVTEWRMKTWLRDIGFNVPTATLSTDPSQVQDAVLNRLRAPLVMKLQSSDMLHKQDAGGVVLNVCTVDAAKQAFSDLNQLAEAEGVDASLQGILIEEMARGPEYFVGVVRHREAGPVVFVAKGGRTVEQEPNRQAALAPVSAASSFELVQRARDGTVKGAADSVDISAEISAVADVVYRLSHIAVDPEFDFDEVDLNPVIVTESAQAVIADAIGLRHFE